MAINIGEIPIYGHLISQTEDNILAYTNNIKDKSRNKTQESINADILHELSNINIISTKVHVTDNITNIEIGTNNIASVLISAGKSTITIESNFIAYNDVSIGSYTKIKDHVSIGNNTIIGGNNLFGTNIIINDRVNIKPDVNIYQNVTIATNNVIKTNNILGKNNRIYDDIIIGTNVNIGDNTKLYVEEISGNCYISFNGNNDAVPISIKSGADIGINAIIENNVNIKENTIIDNNVTLCANLNISTKEDDSGYIIKDNIGKYKQIFLRKGSYIDGSHIGNIYMEFDNDHLEDTTLSIKKIDLFDITNINIGNNTDIGLNAKIGNDIIIGSQVNIGTNINIGINNIDNYFHIDNIIDDVLIYRKFGKNIHIGDSFTVQENIKLHKNSILWDNVNIGTGTFIEQGAQIGPYVSASNITVSSIIANNCDLKNVLIKSSEQNTIHIKKVDNTSDHIELGLNSKIGNIVSISNNVIIKDNTVLYPHVEIGTNIKIKEDNNNIITISTNNNENIKLQNVKILNSEISDLHLNISADNDFTISDNVNGTIYNSTIGNQVHILSNTYINENVHIEDITGLEESYILNTETIIGTNILIGTGNIYDKSDNNKFYNKNVIIGNEVYIGKGIELFSDGENIIIKDRTTNKRISLLLSAT